MSPTAYAWIRTFHIFGVLMWVGSMISLLHILDAHGRAEIAARSAFHRLEKTNAMAMDIGATIAIVFGGILLAKVPGIMKHGYMHAKLALVVLVLLVVHGMLRVKVRKFRETVVKPLPIVLPPLVSLVALAIIILIVARPF